MEKVIHGLTGLKTAPLENLRFLRVLRTRDRIVRSNTECIHSLLRFRRHSRAHVTAKPSPTLHRSFTPCWQLPRLAALLSQTISPPKDSAFSMPFIHSAAS